MGQGAAFQFLVDGSNSTVALHALSVAETIALTESVQILSRAVGEQISATNNLPMQSRSRVLFNPDMRTMNFLIPGFVASLLHPMIIIFTAMAIVREKEEGTLEQLMVTPISRWGLMLGKLMPYTEIAAVELLLCFLVVRYLFGIPFAGNPIVLATGALGFILTALSLGLLLSTIATNQLQAIQFSFLVSFPCDILSGFVFPQEGMPPFIYYIAQISPLTYFMRIIRGVIVRGAGFEDLWPQCAVLFAMGATLVVVSALRFKKTVG
jgi:ABC-2 type transport system permease protein